MGDILPVAEEGVLGFLKQKSNRLEIISNNHVLSVRKPKYGSLLDVNRQFLVT